MIENCESSQHDAIIIQLQKIVAGEWMSYYFYWWAALVCVGPEHQATADHLRSHGEEEKEHADKAAQRLYELGSTPVFNPSEWSQQQPSLYPHPQDTIEFVLTIADQVVRMEEAAKQDWKDLCDLTSECDPATNTMAADILLTECEHSSDFQKIAASVRLSQNC